MDCKHPESATRTPASLWPPTALGTQQGMLDPPNLTYRAFPAGHLAVTGSSKPPLMPRCQSRDGNWEPPDLPLTAAVTPSTPCLAHEHPSLSPRPLPSQSLPQGLRRAPSSPFFPSSCPPTWRGTPGQSAATRSQKAGLHADMGRRPVPGGYCQCHRPTQLTVYLSS